MKPHAVSPCEQENNETVSEVPGLSPNVTEGSESPPPDWIVGLVYLDQLQKHQNGKNAGIIGKLKDSLVLL